MNILDPATGTGTFITNLINHLPVERLEHKYRNEIYANEVAILPYYIANLNIEYTYRERTGRYLEFPNLSFVDTLDNMDWQGAGASGGAVERQAAFNLGGMSEENWIRVQEQNEQTISVIIGNPPYNANQQNENDNNKNREYPAIDRCISETYIAASTAQKTKQYDMYKRFIRWASDRLADDGIVGFVSNSAFLDGRQDDGFRKVVAEEFNELWVVDLKGNARTSGERRRQEGGNVFDDKIRVGVAVYFLVRRKGAKGFTVHYNAVDDYAKAQAKVDHVKGTGFDTFEFAGIRPDAKSNWLDQSDSDFEELLPLANRETKLAKSVADEQAVFGLYSQGIVTARDEWVYDFDSEMLGGKVRAFINEYEESRAKFGGKEFADQELGTVIKWTRALKRQLALDVANTFNRESGRNTIYRPFVKKWLYFNQNLNEMQYQLRSIFPVGKDCENVAIGFCGVASSKPFQILAANAVQNFDTLEKTQCLPLYRYTADGERVSNITEWGLRQFREQYGDDGIGAEDVFAYVYAMLHDPAYRERYEVDLRREFPRVFFQDDFEWWAGKGRELLDLHIGFESVEPWGLERVEAGAGTSTGSGRADGAGTGPSTGSGRAARVILRADRDVGVIRLDGETSLRGVPAEAWEYRLGSRSALEWVLDQYKEKKPRDPTIRERFNTYRFAEHKERVVELLDRVCAVSVATVGIVGELEERSGVERSG